MTTVTAPAKKRESSRPPRDLRSFTIRLPKDVYRDLKIESAKRGIALQAHCEAGLTAFTKANPKALEEALQPFPKITVAEMESLQSCFRLMRAGPGKEAHREILEMILRQWDR